jgi:hypothetical protein
MYFLGRGGKTVIFRHKHHWPISSRALHGTVFTALHAVHAVHGTVL